MFNCECSEKLGDLDRAEGGGIATTTEVDEPSDPAKVSLLRAVAAVAKSKCATNTFV